jgi:hypothetical protein
VPVVTLTEVGFRLDLPSLVLNTLGTDPLKMRCALRKIDHTGDETFEDTETFCTPGGEAPGATKEALDVELLWSYGTTGTYNNLKPLEYSLVSFAFLPTGNAAVSATNPELSGKCYIPFVPFIRADGVKKFSYVPMTFKFSGTPVTTYTPPAVYASHT